MKERELIPDFSLRITVQILWKLVGNFPSPLIGVGLDPQDITLAKQGHNW